ncbi:hypothetical protein HK099_004216 [Clydaea vesicula]|uniref:SF3 helicase domain-containing protein n=1 Tax=Clydaea vesicula TaxID=447962 RepID=A0AAD5U3W6_9FUNG|nr:hypothetical protein HK099_004216 [Clydaea vesicula]
MIIQTKKTNPAQMPGSESDCDPWAIEEVDKFLEKVLPNEQVKNYALKKFSSCLNGNLPNTNFIFFQGGGANGKSQLLNLMAKSMGGFGTKIDSTLITRRRSDANSAIKELTGQEGTIDARNLNEGIVEFKMQAKLFLATNFLPNVDGDDNGILLFLLLSKLMLLISRLLVGSVNNIRMSLIFALLLIGLVNVLQLKRLRVVKFHSVFKENANTDNRFEFERTAFMNILLTFYYKEIFDPPEVIANTEEYREENNELEVWAKENIVYKARSMLG